MKQKEIIELANTRTERKAEKRLNLPLELLCAFQDFVREKEWDWRFGTKVFDTVANQSEYDLTAAPISLTDIADPLNLSLVQDGSKLDEVLDINTKARILNASMTPSTPKQWFQKPGNHDIIVINKPDAVLQLRVIYDALPGSLPNNESIPLVPDHLHSLLADKLELRILKFLLGAEDAKYQSAQAEYQDKLNKA